MLTPNRKHLGRALARRSNYAIVSDILNSQVTRDYLLKKVGVLLRKELTSMSSDKTESILGKQNMADLKSFSWSKVLNELSSNAPILLSILFSCTHTRKPRTNKNAVIGMCSAILLKFRNSKMSMVKKMLSLILYAGNSGKQVC